MSTGCLAQPEWSPCICKLTIKREDRIPYQVPRDELLVLADGERHLARRVDGHVDDSGLIEKLWLKWSFNISFADSISIP